MIARVLAIIALLADFAQAQNDYKSPYSVKFSFKEEELIGDLLKGPRGDWKDFATMPHSQWQDPTNQRRWGHWGPAMKHFSAPVTQASHVLRIIPEGP